MIAGENITILSPTDVIIKSFSPSNHFATHSVSTSGSIIDDNNQLMYTQIRYIKVSNTTLGSSSKPRITNGLIAGTDKGGL